MLTDKELIKSLEWEIDYWHLAGIEKSRVWFYKRGSWLGWCQFGDDEFQRRTLVLGTPYTGAIVFALWRCYCEISKEELAELKRRVNEN